MALELKVNNAMSHPLTVSHNYDSMVWCKSQNQRANFAPTLNNQEAKTPSAKQPQKLDIVWLKCGLPLQSRSRLSIHTHAVVVVKSVLENLVRVVALEWRITWTLLPMRKKNSWRCVMCVRLFCSWPNLTCVQTWVWKHDWAKTVHYFTSDMFISRPEYADVTYWGNQRSKCNFIRVCSLYLLL